MQLGVEAVRADDSICRISSVSLLPEPRAFPERGFRVSGSRCGSSLRPSVRGHCRRFAGCFAKAIEYSPPRPAAAGQNARQAEDHDQGRIRFRCSRLGGEYSFRPKRQQLNSCLAANRTYIVVHAAKSRGYRTSLPKLCTPYDWPACPPRYKLNGRELKCRLS